MRILKPVLVFCLLTCLFATTAAAAVSPTDAAATRSYLLARLKEQREAARSPDAGIEAIHGLASRLGGECPNVLAGTPLAGPESDWSPASTEIHEEISDAVFGASERLEHTTDVRFYTTVKQLRWSNRRFTRLLHDLALEDVRQTGVPAPDLCGDIHFWAANGYASVSPGTTRELRELQAASSTATIEVEPGEKGLGLDVEAVVRHRLLRYENNPDRRLAKRVFAKVPALDSPRVEAALEAFFAAFEQVETALGAPART